MASDYDGAWKDLLHRRLRDVLACFFPAVEKAVDWTHAPEFLEQELRELAIDDASVENRVDLLVRVHMLDGLSQILYLHIEVQSFPETEFPKRVATSNHRIRAGCGEDVISLVILADLDPTWKPQEYRHERLGCETLFRFPCCKLLEILPRLENEDSLPALAAKAQIEALRTSRHPDKRLAARWILTRKLYEAGWEKKEIHEALRLLTWMMQLPDPEYLILRKEMVAYEKEHPMSTTLLDYERYARKVGRQEGRQEARQEATLRLLELRFGRVPEGLKEAVREIANEAHLEQLFETAATCSDIETFAAKL